MVLVLPMKARTASSCDAGPLFALFSGGLVRVVGSGQDMTASIISCRHKESTLVREEFIPQLRGPEIGLIG